MKRQTPPLEIEPLEQRCLPSGDMVLRWNAVALDAVRHDYDPGHAHDQGGPTRDSRALAIVSAAAADALDAVTHSFTPYLVHLHARPGTSAAAAVAAAAHDTLASLYPQQRERIDAAFQASVASLTHRGTPGVRLGVRLGHRVAARVLAARQGDGSAANPVYSVGDQPGQWQPDPTHPDQAALGVAWGAVTPFCMVSGAQFRVPPPPPLGSRAYAAAFHEVKALGGDGVHTPTRRTHAETVIGLFWGYDGTPGLGTPPVLYNEVARVLARQEHNTEAENARLFALVNLAMADTGIAVWGAKYADNLWRPVTAIRAAGGDGNRHTGPDPAWTPLGAPADNGAGTNFTPAFPAYPSGHAGFGGALFRVLAEFYGTDRISFTIGSDEFNGHTRDQDGNVRPVVRRHFDSFSQAAEENGQSRIYLGIHWRFDKVEGIRLGRHVADFVFQHFLRPL